MGWLRDWFQRKDRGDKGLAARRLARFRALLRAYGRFLDLVADAAEKQSGEYVFDRAYVAALVERALDAAEAVTFHGVALGGSAYQDAFGILDRMREEVRVFPSQPDDDDLRRLREFRRLAFPLTGDLGPETSPRSLHDLVHAMHERAGEAVATFIRDFPDWDRAVEVRVRSGLMVRVLDLQEVLDPVVMSGSVCDETGVRSAALGALVEGMAVVPVAGGEAPDDRLGLMAVATGEWAFLLAFSPSGSPDMVDAKVTGASEFNHVYARFAASPEPRGALAGEVLQRLEFAVAGTVQGQSAWVSGLSAVETRERLGLVGRLFERLRVLDQAGWDRVAVPGEVAGLLA